MEASEQTQRPSVVIAGGGIAGLEALLGLRELAGDRIAVTLVAPDPEFTYKPLVVDEPFSSKPADRRELAPLVEELGAGFLQQAVSEVRPQDHTVVLGDGSALPYNVLVVCVGGKARPVLQSAATFWATGQPLEIKRLLTEAAESPSRRLAFVVPPGVSWALPAYEVAMMSERQARSMGIDGLEVEVFTPESAPLIIFGRVASDAVAAVLAARGIKVRAGASVSEENGELTIHPGGKAIDAGAVIALPIIHGPEIPGLPFDEGGFIPIDGQARVVGVDDVYAAGDGTNFPIKQGGIGTQQADAAASHIAARFGAPVEAEGFRPVLRGKLITGDETLSMRADIAGGGGEGIASPDYLWWPPHKVSGRYLAPWLEGSRPPAYPDPPGQAMEVEVAFPSEWHSEPQVLDLYGPPPVD